MCDLLAQVGDLRQQDARVLTLLAALVQVVHARLGVAAAVRELQRREALLHVLAHGVDRRDHRRVRIAAQRVR